MITRRTLLQKAGVGLMAYAGLAWGRSLSDAATEGEGAVAKRRPTRLFLCGDVMTGRGIDQVLREPCDPQLFESYVKSATRYVELAEAVNGPIDRPVAPKYIWGDALGELHRLRPDARIVNLETSVTTSDDHWPGKGIHYRMNPANVACLSAAGIDCCVLANNHVLDWGYAGLEETLATLRRTGIAGSGAGRSADRAARPCVLPLAADRRAIVYACCTGTSGVPAEWAAQDDKPGVNRLDDLSAATARRIGRELDGVRRQGDVVVVSIHWGDNWGYRVPRRQIDFAHALVDDAGVDVVHGHSSHHAKAIEVYRERLILYGCGDFITDYEGIGGHERYRGDLSLMYFVDLDANGTLAGVLIRPMQMRRFQARHATAADTKWVAKVLDREGGAFGTRVERSKSGELVLRWGAAGHGGVPLISN